jgi:NAD(P)-dependent dehydrogenase (short-subunit alcohol dehydrogenase family)
VRATVLDPAHVAEQTSPTTGRNLLITGLAGLLVGLAVAAALTPGRSVALATAAVDPRVEQRLHARIDQVAQRERALAQRAGQLAARERDLARREQDLERQAAACAAAAAASEPEPQPEPEPEPEPAAALPPQHAGRWTLQELEALTGERSSAGASPEQQEEWSTYLFFLRDHADANGSLPAGLDQLIGDVFGPLPRAD